MEAGKYGLLYEKIDERGWPIYVRVGRQCSTVLETTQAYSDLNPDQPIVIQGIPRYQEVIDNGTGYYFRNPEEAGESQVYYDMSKN